MDNLSRKNRKGTTVTVKYTVRPIGKKPLGLCAPKFITEKEAKEVKNTGKYKYLVWPDRDSFNYLQELESEVIKITTTVVKEFF
jgi:hypothetical protein